MSLKISLEKGTTVTKRKQWITWKQLLQKFTEEEIEAHLSSGRVLWREDPLTQGATEYHDQGERWEDVTGRKSKTLTLDQGEDCTLEKEELFGTAFDRELDSLLLDASTLRFDSGSSSLGKGTGKKGMSFWESIGKGHFPHKGRPGKGGRGRGRGKQLAIEDGEPPSDKEDPTPEEQVEEATSKARKMRNLLQLIISNFEENFELFKKTKFCTAKARRDADETLLSLKSFLGKLKKPLQKGWTWTPSSHSWWRQLQLPKPARARSRSSGT